MADPVTQQIASRSDWQRRYGEDPAELRDAAQCLLEDEVGRRIPFGALYRDQKTILIFVRALMGSVFHNPVRIPERTARCCQKCCWFPDVDNDEFEEHNADVEEEEEEADHQEMGVSQQ